MQEGGPESGMMASYKDSQRAGFRFSFRAEIQSLWLP